MTDLSVRSPPAIMVTVAVFSKVQNLTTSAHNLILLSVSMSSVCDSQSCPIHIEFKPVCHKPSETVDAAWSLPSEHIVYVNSVEVCWLPGCNGSCLS